jgi:hypothetical protein
VNCLEEGGIEDIVESLWLDIATICQNANFSLCMRASISKLT